MEKTTLVIKKMYQAPVAEVWRAWTDPNEVASWYGPEGFTTEIHEFDFRKGGNYRLTMKAPDGTTHPLHGTFMECNPMKKLVMTWQWENTEGMSGMNAETLVTVEFAEHKGGTEMLFKHEKFPTQESADNHTKGWTSSFVKLDAKLLVA